MVTKLLRLIGTMEEKPACESGLPLALHRQARYSFGGVVLRAFLRGPAREAKDVTFLIHGDRFGSIAGKVKTCFSRAFSQANPTVEIHGA
jgi:hypothetical protein